MQKIIGWILTIVGSIGLILLLRLTIDFSLFFLGIEISKDEYIMVWGSMSFLPLTINSFVILTLLFIGLIILRPKGLIRKIYFFAHLIYLILLIFYMILGAYYHISYNATEFAICCILFITILAIFVLLLTISLCPFKSNQN